MTLINQRKYRTHAQYVEELFNINPNIEVLDTFINMVTKIHHQCKICGHIWEVKPHDLLSKGRTRCPECSKWNAAKNRQKQNYNIGQVLNDAERDITITNVQHMFKSNGYKIWKYQYICNKCGFDCGRHYKDGVEVNEYWTTQDNLNWGKGCACCAGRITVPHINSIYAHRFQYGWMINYFKNKDDAKKYPLNYSKKILLTCPECGKEKYISPHTLKDNGFGCICGDGFSYPEKFLYNILEQLNVTFEYHKTFDWSKCTSCGTKIYDFYIPEHNLIIETHGLQHYQESFGRKLSQARTLEQEQENDLFKKQIAIQNHIKHYIELNCSESDCYFIYNSILESQLLNILCKQSALINIEKADIYASSNLIKLCANLYNNKMNIIDIATTMKINRATVRKYLKKANQFGWCVYTSNKSR